MCYHCATNPSIHHRCHCVAAVSSPLSHHGVTFVITLSRFCHRRHSVTFASVTVLSSLLWCCLRVGHGFVVAVAVLPLSSHCHGFVVVVVLPSSSHCHGVIVMVSLSPLWCHLHRRIVAVSL